jgi:hypothetical protein
MNGSDPLDLDERLRLARRGELDPVSLDREIGRAARHYEQWLRALPDDPDSEDDPLQPYRAVSRRTTFADVQGLGETDPLRSYLSRWLLCLAERRVNGPLMRALLLRCRVQKWPLHNVPLPEATLQQVLQQALRDPARCEPWLQQLSQHGPPLLDAVTPLWERRSELARRWGFASWEQASGCGVAASALAQQWLQRTQDIVHELQPQPLPRWLEVSLGCAATAEWPAHLNARSLIGLFAGTPMLTVLTWDSSALPQRLAPASFLRGLLQLGEHWARASAPADQFFVVAREPFALHEHRYGALFAQLATGVPLLRHQLGCSGDKLLQSRRALQLSLLLHSRALAFRVLQGSAALHGRSALRETFADEARRCLGVALRPEACGALFAPRLGDAQRFIATLLAAEHEAQLVEAHDEDWFRNPRAVEQLQAEVSLPPLAHVEQELCDRAAARLQQRLLAALG